MNEQEQQIRIAIVDDHEMFRAGVIATLQPHFDIVGQAAWYWLSYKNNFYPFITNLINCSSKSRSPLTMDKTTGKNN